jgi:hypothetical protein
MSADVPDLSYGVTLMNEEDLSIQAVVAGVDAYHKYRHQENRTPQLISDGECRAILDAARPFIVDPEINRLRTIVCELEDDKEGESQQLALMDQIDHMKNALNDLEEYTGALWYGSPNLSGRAEEIVRNIRGRLGSISYIYRKDQSPGCNHIDHSWSGMAPTLSLDDPAKVWRCDNCLTTGTTTELNAVAIKQHGGWIPDFVRSVLEAP